MDKIIDKFVDNEIRDALIHYIFTGDKVSYILSSIDKETLNEIGKEVYNAAETLIKEGESVDLIKMRERTGYKGKKLASVLKEPKIPLSVKMIVKAHNRQQSQLKIYGALSNWREQGDTLQDFDKWVNKLISYKALAGDEDNIVSATDGLKNVSEYIKKIREGVIKRYKTGLFNLDELVGYIEGGEVVIIGARPSVGKTALMLQIAKNLSSDFKVGIFSLEMTTRALMFRVISDYTGETKENLISKVADIDLILSKVAQQINTSNFIFNETALSAANLSAQFEKMVKAGAKVIFIDYVQLISHAAGSNYEGYSAISRKIKELAKKYLIPVIILSQLNRKPEERQYGRPITADLRETGQLEQDADKIFLLWRPPAEYFNGVELSIYENLAREGELLAINASKNRDGGVGEIYLRFDKNLMKIRGIEY